VERGIQVGRYSFIGMSPSSTLRLDHDELTITRGERVSTTSLNGRDPLAFVRDEIALTGLAECDDISYVERWNPNGAHHESLILNS